ncbi:MAG: hypothetical protein OXG74_00905 [Acidobacteria bacterium]|nr:hypothetical protein [Acidobacteriota bacterium]
MERVLDTIVELQEASVELTRSLTLLDGVPESMQELHDQYETSRSEIEELEEEQRLAELERRAAEAERAAGKDSIERYQEQISRVTTQREYGALLSEIDTVRAQMREADDRALLALEQQDVAAGRLDELRGAFESLDQQYQEALAAWEEQKPAMRKRVQVLEGRIEVFRERLPPAALKQYQRLFERHGGAPLAVIRVIESAKAPIRHCSFCNYRIRPQVVLQIQTQGAIVPCDSCQRILYLDDGESD